MWRALLIDYGGTLDGDGVHWSRRFADAFRAQGLALSGSGIEPAFRASEERMAADPRVPAMGLEEAVRFQAALILESLRSGNGPRDGGEDRDVLETAARQLLADTRRILARNARVLRSLHRRFRIGVLSNFNGGLEGVLVDEGLRREVDAVFDSAIVGRRKPDPAFFLEALRLLEAAPAEVLMIGDSIEMDLRPARALGMATAWIAGARSCPADFRPDLTARDLPELASLLEAYGAPP